MGGSTDRLNVVPIYVVHKEDQEACRATRTATRRFLSGSSDTCRPSSLEGGQGDGDGVKEIRKRFQTFDARKAKCFKLEDRVQGLNSSPSHSLTATCEAAGLCWLLWMGLSRHC
jgi:hypothetical protein